MSFEPTLNSIAIAIKAILGIRLFMVLSVSAVRVVADVSCYRSMEGVSFNDQPLFVLRCSNLLLQVVAMLIVLALFV